MNNKRPCLFGLATLLVGFGIITSSTHAQVIPDGTLSTSVTSSDNQNFVIENGDRNGNNLFHSFSEFSIPTDGSARFNNAADIETIFSRVTGTNISNIDGLMQTNGNASLFLLNPNGILFGPNARLDIGGSFFGTTADTLLFGDGNSFSTTAPVTSSLLSVSVPAGLQWNQIPSPMTLQNATLEGATGTNLALLGGELNLTGSTLTTAGGRLILGGLATTGTVQLDGVNSVNFPDKVPRSSVILADASDVSVETGSIDIFSNALRLSDESRLETATNSLNNTGNITLNVEDSIELTDSVIESSTFGPGDGGHIVIETGKLRLIGSNITSRTRAGGNAGDIYIQAQASVDLNANFETRNRASIVSVVNTGASGNGGEIEIDTSILHVLNGAQISTSANGTGESGNIAITASESVDLRGVFESPSSVNFSSILTTSSSNSMIANGNVTITTGQLRLMDGAQVSTSPFGAGDGGTVIVVARDSIDIIGRGPDKFPTSSGIFTGPQFIGSSGDGGDIILRTGQLQLADRGLVFSIAGDSGSGGNIVIDANSVKLNNGNILANSFGEGNAGDLRIVASQTIFVENFSRIAVSARGGGDAGDLEIFASNILLDQKGRIRADTSGGDEGNIQLVANEALVLRRGSSITTNATGPSTGGNIDITSPVIVAVPAEDSDIVANAIEGNGGRIQIESTGIFGLELRPELTPLSDITASSQFGVAGIVQIQTPDLDPSQGIVELPSSLTDPSTQITTGCAAMAEHSFTVTGRGGLPAAPDTHNSSATWIDWRPLETEERTDPVSIAVSQASLREATAMVTDINGEVQLVASTAELSNAYRGVNKASCGSRGDA